jgi:hypothetical protein
MRQVKYGITSFVYCRRRPLHPQRLMKVILQLPVKVDPHSGDLVDNWQFPGVAAPAADIPHNPDATETGGLLH